ncbi:MAG: hypothetical protein ACJ8G7_21675 [Rhizobacter sp.]
MSASAMTAASGRDVECMPTSLQRGHCHVHVHASWAQLVTGRILGTLISLALSDPGCAGHVQASDLMSDCDLMVMALTASNVMVPLAVMRMSFGLSNVMLLEVSSTWLLFWSWMTIDLSCR